MPKKKKKEGKSQEKTSFATIEQRLDARKELLVLGDKTISHFSKIFIISFCSVLHIVLPGILSILLDEEEENYRFYTYYLFINMLLFNTMDRIEFYIREMIELFFFPTHYIDPIKQFCLGEVLCEDIEPDKLNNMIDNLKKYSDSITINWPTPVILMGTSIWNYLENGSLIYLLIPSLTPLMFTMEGYNSVPSETMIANQMLNPLNELIPGWQSAKIRKHCFYIFNKTMSPEKLKILTTLLSDCSFPIVQKKPTLVIICHYILSKTKLEIIKKKLKKQWDAIEEAEQFIENFKKRIPDRLGLPWSFHIDDAHGYEKLGFIGMTTLYKDTLREKIVQALSEIPDLSIKQQFSTITIKGSQNKKILSDLSKKLQPIIDESETANIVSLTPLSTLKEEEEAPIEKNEKIKTKGFSSIQENNSTFFKKPKTHLEWKISTHLGIKDLVFTETRKILDPDTTAKYLFTKNNVDYYGYLDLTDTPSEYENTIRKGFEKGYMPQSSGNCISEANRKKEGCSFKIRTSDDVRVKPYTATHINPKTRKKSKLLYFCVFDNNPHDYNRNKKILSLSE